MQKTLGLSPKLAAAIGPPLTAVVTAMILTNTVDRTSLAALAAIAIGAVLGYHAPAGAAKPLAPGASSSVVLSGMVGTMGSNVTSDWRKGVEVDTGDDGDDRLPAELHDREPDPTPVDEVDVADLNHPEVH